MRRKLTRLMSVLLILALTVSVAKYTAEESLTVKATSIDKVKDKINALNNEINTLNQNIENMEEKQEILEEEMEDLNSEIINTMTSIDLKEEEIAEKEVEIEDKESDIEDTAEQYEASKAQAEQQFEDMVVRLRKMYENGEESGLNLLLSGTGLGDMLNRMDFVESIYAYDRGKQEEYVNTQNLVLELWNQLEVEKLNLETDKTNLEADRTALESQREELNGLLARKKQQSANYESEIKKARQEASVAKAKLKQEQQELKKLQAAGGGKNAANGTYTTDYNSIIDGASGSELGKQVAKYACQFVGNPYVPGGTSLTNGADCSGFTYRVYSDFGYGLPRTSTEQRSAGKGVEYSEAQPGDLICYSGHVALYIGGGKIVHASTQKTGIKIGNAQYRTILAVRRIV